MDKPLLSTDSQMHGGTPSAPLLRAEPWGNGSLVGRGYSFTRRVCHHRVFQSMVGLG